MADAAAVAVAAADAAVAAVDAVDVAVAVAQSWPLLSWSWRIRSFWPGHELFVSQSNHQSINQSIIQTAVFIFAFLTFNLIALQGAISEYSL